jgi:hypothetical protein
MESLLDYEAIRKIHYLMLWDKEDAESAYETYLYTVMDRLRRSRYPHCPNENEERFGVRRYCVRHLSGVLPYRRSHYDVTMMQIRFCQCRPSRRRPHLKRRGGALETISKRQRTDQRAMPERPADWIPFSWRRRLAEFNAHMVSCILRIKFERRRNSKPKGEVACLVWKVKVSGFWQPARYYWRFNHALEPQRSGIG